MSCSVVLVCFSSAIQVPGLVWANWLYASVEFLVCRERNGHWDVCVSEQTLHYEECMCIAWGCGILWIIIIYICRVATAFARRIPTSKQSPALPEMAWHLNCFNNKLSFWNSVEEELGIECARSLINSKKRAPGALNRWTTEETWTVLDEESVGSMHEKCSVIQWRIGPEMLQYFLLRVSLLFRTGGCAGNNLPDILLVKLLCYDMKCGNELQFTWAFGSKAVLWVSMDICVEMHHCV